VNWKNGTESWVKRAELKDSYPIELAEFAKARSIADEPDLLGGYLIPSEEGMRSFRL
jgi:hypothetical protein